MIDFEDDTIAHAIRSLSPAEFVDALIANDFDDVGIDCFQFFQWVGRHIKQRKRQQPQCGHLTASGVPCVAKRLLGRDGCKHHACERSQQR